MRILIIEDESYTAEHLKKLLVKIDPLYKPIAIFDTVKESIKWLQNNPLPDLIFQDIVLKDGICFEIYDTVNINVPVIFTTAYSDYALQSFRVNNIDYIVKPYDFEDIKRVLQKYQEVKTFFQIPDLALMKEIMSASVNVPRKRFLVKNGDKYFTIKSESIVYFFYDEGLTTGVTCENKKFIVDISINELNNQLDEKMFYQVNRKYLVNIEYIVKIIKWFNNRLKIEMEPSPEEEIIVSRDRVRLFKEWLNQ